MKTVTETVKPWPMKRDNRTPFSGPGRGSMTRTLPDRSCLRRSGHASVPMQTTQFSCHVGVRRCGQIEGLELPGSPLGLEDEVGVGLLEDRPGRLVEVRPVEASSRDGACDQR